MKKVMFFGGAGRVGSLIVPLLARDCEAHVYDLRPPEYAGAVYHEGDVTDRDAVRAATEGMDAVVYMAMVPLSDFHNVSLCYDIYLKGLHFVLEAVRDFKIGQAIYCSTGSVYGGLWSMKDKPVREDVITDDQPPDASRIYGMTKALGEQVCSWFCEHFDMTVFVLRLYRPMSYDDWNQIHCDEPTGRGTAISTLDRDLARAFGLALESPRRGCHVMSVCGDWRGQVVDCRRARDLLGWEPTPWPA